MTVEYGTPISPLEEEPEQKKNTTLIIVIVVLLVLCCCCVMFGGILTWLWFNGDQLFEEYLFLSQLIV